MHLTLTAHSAHDFQNGKRHRRRVRVPIPVPIPVRRLGAMQHSRADVPRAVRDVAVWRGRSDNGSTSTHGLMIGCVVIWLILVCASASTAHLQFSMLRHGLQPIPSPDVLYVGLCATLYDSLCDIVAPGNFSSMRWQVATLNFTPWFHSTLTESLVILVVSLCQVAARWRLGGETRRGPLGGSLLSLLLLSLRFKRARRLVRQGARFPPSGYIYIPIRV